MLKQTKRPKTYNKLLSGYPEVMNIDQMCSALGGISTRTGYKLLKEGKIKSIKVGREYRIIKSYVTDFLLGKAQ
ncbi:MAG: helix-turn-helix domain-containing protein [Clostridia bacterium]|nr:helix-turn-helix domain-containing protein [Clostridia bacterium]